MESCKNVQPVFDQSKIIFQVLTAAHCVDAERYGKNAGTHVVVGTNDLKQMEFKHKILRSHIHPDYYIDVDNQVVSDDIAVLELETPISYAENAEPILMINYELKDGDGPVTLFGFGLQQGMGLPSQLQKSDNEFIVGIDKCKWMWDEQKVFQNPGVHPSNICSMSKGTTAACSGM